MYPTMLQCDLKPRSSLYYPRGQDYKQAAKFRRLIATVEYIWKEGCRVSVEIHKEINISVPPAEGPPRIGSQLQACPHLEEQDLPTYGLTSLTDEGISLPHNNINGFQNQGWMKVLGSTKHRDSGFLDTLENSTAIT